MTNECIVELGILHLTSNNYKKYHSIAIILTICHLIIWNRDTTALFLKNRLIYASVYHKYMHYLCDLVNANNVSVKSDKIG